MPAAQECDASNSVEEIYHPAGRLIPSRLIGSLKPSKRQRLRRTLLLADPHNQRAKQRPVQQHGEGKAHTAASCPGGVPGQQRRRDGDSHAQRRGARPAATRQATAAPALPNVTPGSSAGQAWPPYHATSASSQPAADSRKAQRVAARGAR